MPHVLILNAGSSSLKWVVLDADSEIVVTEHNSSWDAGRDGAHQPEIEAALAEAPAVDAIGHRVVHGGTRFREPLVVDEQVRQGIAELVELAPLHNPAALAGIDAASKRLPGVPQVAAFDTAFHASMPDAAALLPVPWEWSERWQLRRFGFHGLSVQYATQRAAELLGVTPRRVIVCHLGAGCSVTAVLDGRSVDTSMSFTPLDGVMMARRSGALDPGLLLYLLEARKLSLKDLAHGLNDEAGLRGVSGVSADMREVLAAEEAGNTRARLAIDMFVHRLVVTIGGMAASLDGVDALVFTGGIGEHSPTIRRRVVDRLHFIGVRVAVEVNEAASADLDISAQDSRVHVMVVSAREDLSILRAVKQVLRENGGNWG